MESVSFEEGSGGTLSCWYWRWAVYVGGKLVEGELLRRIVGGVDQTIGHLSVQIFPSGNLLHRGTRRKLIAFEELLCCNS